MTVISRCENRQKAMKAAYPHLRFIIGDITREWQTWPEADYVFNFAAMKHVEISEQNVGACIDINLLGTINFANYCETRDVTQGIFTSTDKAVLPINSYGLAKGLAENYLLWRNPARFQVFRWGNVAGSRGSVIPIFKEALEKGRTVFVTDKRMSRFWIHIDDVCDFMLTSLHEGPGPHIPPMKAAKLLDVIQAIAECVGVENYEIIETGIRDGEKIHECLKTSHDWCLRSDNCEQYTKRELSELVQRVLDICRAPAIWASGTRESFKACHLLRLSYLI